MRGAAAAVGGALRVAAVRAIAGVPAVARRAPVAAARGAGRAADGVGAIAAGRAARRAVERNEVAAARVRGRQRRGWSRERAAGRGTVSGGARRRAGPVRGERAGGTPHDLAHRHLVTRARPARLLRLLLGLGAASARSGGSTGREEREQRGAERARASGELVHARPCCTPGAVDPGGDWSRECPAVASPIDRETRGFLVAGTDPLATSLSWSGDPQERQAARTPARPPPSNVQPQ